MRIVLLGPPGSGKGTQAALLASALGVPAVSTGELFRAHVAAGTELGRTAAAFATVGDLVPDDVTTAMLVERLDEPDCLAGYLLDGFPRTVGQAELLAKVTADEPLDLVIDLVVPTDVVLERLASRRVCTDCATNYSLDAPPKYGWVCDNCGGDVVQRADDTPEAIQKRLDLYERETAPLIEWYDQRDLLAAVDGLGSADEVTARLVAAIDERRA